MPEEKKKKRLKKQKNKATLSQKLLRMISVILLLAMVTIILATYKGLDVIYLAYSAIKMFYGEREITAAYEDGGSEFFLAMDNIEREYEVNVEIYAQDGKFVYASSYKGEMSEPPYNGDVIELPESEKKNYEETMDLGETNDNMFKLFRDTESGKNSEYLVGTWKTEAGIELKIFKLKSVVDTNAQIAFTFISAVTIILLSAALIVVAIFVRHITKPLNEMSRVTHNMSKLDFSKKCAPNNVAEISLLSDSINEMSDSLETALVDLRQKNKKLQDDIEQEKTIDQLRQVFIAGISHELKTPIAIIQGYSEGLKLFLESDPEMAAKYCDTIIEETNRMNSLVMQLLDIIKYESGEYKLLYADFNLYDTVQDWIDRNSEILKEKGITAVNEIGRDFTAFGDSFILSSVVNNYMSNAVSHVSGDMRICVSAAETEKGNYRVSIFNTGTPIAAKDIDQIWNSFYRADKAMSRSQGHFGLGLAIVAAIQKLHEQEYGVLNHEDGVEFWFDVKKFDQ